ncbi:hypothetical protein CG717_09760 [Streptomyces sp. CB02613]|uniref:hypothetical protein n=1 Tax=Streptomyces sp. CB02613 TaxID=2020328 RepID=UPI000C27F614|nr:hypothetical protein [Streptomyces sp. CB02613]PJN32945.1 hypothetical protein CG717_09760 [Streptomyces sp. CB02613]
MHDPTGNSDDLPVDFGLTGLGGSFCGDGALFAADQGGSSGSTAMSSLWCEHAERKPRLKAIT